jgi:hypothetical protein
MAVLKYYDGTDWEPIVSALQGPTGPSVTGATGPTGATGVVNTDVAITTNFMLGGM